MFINLVIAAERQDRVEHERALQIAIGYKDFWEQELKRREVEHLISEEPVPDPDDIHIDYSDDTWEIRGPLTKEQKKYWKWVQYFHLDCKERIADLEKEIKKNPSSKFNDQLETARKNYAWTLSMFEVKKDWKRRVLENEGADIFTD